MDNFSPDPVLDKKNNESPIFICTQCGECCHIREQKNISEIEEQAYKNYMFKHYGIIYLANLSEITINIWPEEKEILEKQAQNLGITVDIKPKRAVYDKKGHRLIILDYYIDHDICPFFDRKNKLCNIHKDRPLICKSYPLTSTRSYGKCKYKKLSFEAYGSEKDYARELVSRVEKQKSTIKQMIVDNEIITADKLTEDELNDILNTAKFVELRI